MQCWPSRVAPGSSPAPLRPYLCPLAALGFRSRCRFRPPAGCRPAVESPPSMDSEGLSAPVQGWKSTTSATAAPCCWATAGSEVPCAMM